MRRQNPLFTPIGIILTVALLGGLAVMFLVHGGEAFSPGPLTALSVPGVLFGDVETHADLAHECDACHQPLKTNMAVLCLGCHTDIQAELDAGEGLHARMPGVEKCYDCHSDHRGPNFDPTEYAREELNHELLRFSLVHHQVDYTLAPLACENCHDDAYSADQIQCVECHAANDPVWMADHQAQAGETCLACHDGLDRMENFDHAATAFPLVGLHQDADCSACHVDSQMTGLPQACFSCHTEPALHAGLFPGDCGECHTPAGWSPAALNGQPFDHSQLKFTLAFHKQNFDGSALTCRNCHGEAFTPVDLAPCLVCHQVADRVFMDQHVLDFGTDCLACHDGSGNLANFDHALFFPLDGAHAEAKCEGCHVNRVFRGTPTECSACHQEPPIHAGVFGLQCANCHTTTAWAPALLTNHTFPLNHGDEGEIPCQTCHPNKYTEYTCDACHDPGEMRRKHTEEGIANYSNCMECHPTGQEEEGEGGDD